MKIKITLLAALLFLFSFAQNVIAEGETETRTVSVTDYGANGSDTADDTPAFNRALSEALNTEGTLVVTIPAGTYYLGNNVPIFSDTTVEADENATIIATYTSATPMLYGAHVSSGSNICSGTSCSHGGYSQAHDVTIIGGTWDRGTANCSSSGTVFSFRHAQNITIKNLTVEHCTDHFINISGVNNALIDHVTFLDAVQCTGTAGDYWGDYSPGDIKRYSSLEAVHMDFCNAAGENSDRARPFDNTATKNVTVSNCTFNNVFVGVGNHHPAVSDRTTNIVITDNTFTDIWSYVFYSNGFDGLVISNNTITNAASFGSFTDTDMTAEHNSCSITDPHDYKYNGIQFPENTKAVFNDITITNASLSGVGIYKGSKVTIQGGTISNPGQKDTGTFGVYINNAQATISGLTINKSPSHGVYVYDNSKLTIRNSQIKKSTENGIRVRTKSSLTADGVTITEAAKFGIMIDEGCSATIENTKVGTSAEAAYRIMKAKNVSLIGCSVTATAGRSVYVTDTGSIKIKNCTFDKTVSNYTAVTINNSPAKVVGNTISNAGSHGLVIENSNGSLIKKNTVSNCAGIAIRVISSQNCMIDGNTVNNKKSSSTHALEIKGESSSKKASACIRDNYLNAPNSGAQDLKVGAYATVTLRDNTLVNSKKSYDSTASVGNARVFSDVKKGKFYYDAVHWAYDYGITTGKTDTKFEPEPNCTRAEIVTFLWRTMGEPEPKKTAYDAYFTDTQANKFYSKAVNWAYEQGITTGLNDGTGRFGINNTCTRAMCVTFLWRAAGKPEPVTPSSFEDVSESSYYYSSVSWAFENGITTGISATEFGPSGNVSRGQTVTFLYRYVLSDFYED
ncbi:MAG: right-handed parallel beta-helix repeat-containing protein [Erysipelotrichaceae bacterium]|nr:right-handed parallel beta-helix repeat-containing protein [Erysipelotrichaceae bacterium]